MYSSNIPHSSRSLKVEGLIPGETYTFRIMATSDRGNSPYSAASMAVSTRLARESLPAVLSSCEIKAGKTFRPERDSNPRTLQYSCSALPTELSSSFKRD